MFVKLGSPASAHFVAARVAAVAAPRAAEPVRKSLRCNLDIESRCEKQKSADRIR